MSRMSKRCLVGALAIMMILAFMPQQSFAATGFTKSKAVINQGKSVVLKVKGFKKKPHVTVDNWDGKISCKVLSKTRIKVTAARGGYGLIGLRKNGNNYGSTCMAIVMPKSKTGGAAVTKTDAGTEVTYRGIKVTLPKAWQSGRYFMMQYKGVLTFYSLSDYKGGFGGRVFSIHKGTMADYNNYKEATGAYLMAQNGDTVYFMSTPSDVQFNSNSKTAIANYNALSNTESEVISSAVLV